MMETGDKRSEVEVEGFIDKREVSRRLRTSMRTVDEWMRLGLLPYYKLGSSVRFKWSEIEHHFGLHYRVTPPTPSKR
jgi:excisionase family DNA binding protein